MIGGPRAPAPELVSLELDAPLWERVHTVAPLVLVGTVGPDDIDDLAPKHMAMPLGWSPYYCFVCAPRHATYRNAIREGGFTVSYPTPDQVVETSLAATARQADDTKPALAALETFPARAVRGPLVVGARLFLECVLDRTIDGFGENSLVVGRVVAASAPASVLRDVDRDDAELVHEAPLLAYLAPARFARIDESHAFPLPTDFRL